MISKRFTDEFKVEVGKQVSERDQGEAQEIYAARRAIASIRAWCRLVLSSGCEDHHASIPRSRHSHSCQ